MPVVDTVERNLFIEGATALVNVVRDIVDPRGGPADPDAVADFVHPVMERVLPLLPGLVAARPGPREACIVADDVQPGTDQVTVSGFSELLGRKLAASGVIPVASVPTTAALIARTLKMLLRSIDPETYVRWITGLSGALNPEKIADALEAEIISRFNPKQERELEDFPMPDDDKEREEGVHAVPTGVSKLIAALVRKVPGGAEKSDRRVGVQVHQAIMAAYVASYPEHLVVADGRARIAIVVDNITQVQSMTISRIWTDVEPPDDPAGSKVHVFWQCMRDRQTRRRIHPDIADLDQAATGSNPASSWGWFEIKPLHDLGKAYKELNDYYLPAWNDYVVGNLGKADWVAKPGTWQPPLTGVLLKTDPKRVFGAITAPPGCIGYVTYELKEGAEAAAVSVVTTLATMLVRKMLQEARKALEELGLNPDAVGTALLAVGLVIVLVAIIALFVGAQIVAWFAALAAALAAAVTAALAALT